MTDQNLTPVEASLHASALLECMDKLSTLDLHPVENAADLETMHARAVEMTRELLAYLLTSENFVPVVEAPDAVQEWDL